MRVELHTTRLVYIFCKAAFAFLIAAAFVMAPALYSQETEVPVMFQKLNQTIEAVNGLNNDVFKNKNMKMALINKLEAVRGKLVDGEYEEAMDKLEQDILSKMNGCALYSYPEKNDWLITCPAQNEIYSLIDDTIRFIALWYGSYFSVFEEYPGWMTPDLAVTALTVDPERSDPGEKITFTATVANLRKGEAASSTLTFLVDDEVVDEIAVGHLGAGTSTDVTTTWTAGTPGRHQVGAEVTTGEGVVDKDWSNNTASTSAWVSGEADPEPELLFADVDFDALELSPGEPGVIPVTVRNPSFATISGLAAVFSIDGEIIMRDGDDCAIGSDDRICLPYREIIDLAPGEEQELHVPLSEVTPGQHTVEVILNLSETFPDAEYKAVKGWTFIIPYLKALVCSEPGKDRWVSIGPSTLTDIPTHIYAHTHFAKDGNVGRMDNIAFHSTNQNIMYATAPTGGLWKTTDGGTGWFPLGDGLPTLNVYTVAIDPLRPDVVYQSTDKGIYKSINGGATWSLFASHSITGSVREIIVRNPSAGDVLIYAASNIGVLRYKSSSPLANTSTVAEWVNIKSGNVSDLETGGRHSTVYASFIKKEQSASTKKYYNVFDGLYRTLSGSTTSGSPSDWESITSGLPTLPSTSDPKDKPRTLLFDISWGNSQYMYAIIDNPPSQDGKLGIYYSDTWGTSWDLKEYVTRDGYNAFTRIDPYNKDRIYFGGVHLYMRNYSGASGSPVVVGDNRVHDDMKSLQFDPFDLNYYYVLSDGSIWRCRSGSTQDCSPRSYDLRTTQFYDFDISSTDPSLIIGGTQDNGTILYQGSSDWKSIKGGDGNFSLIAPGNKLYAQHQRLRDTVQCDKDSACGWIDWLAANGVNDTCKQQNNCNKLPDEDTWGWGKAYITYHPNDATGNYLLSQGKQVYMTTDGGKNWYQKGPAGSNVKQNSFITRVVVQPSTYTWIAGNSKGQIWYTSNPNAGWNLLDEHPFNAAVSGMSFAPTDHKILYVLFSVSGEKAYTRIYRYEMNPGPPVSWSAYPITDNFPANLVPRTITGDGYDPDVAYVGTHKGGVYRWESSKPTYESWKQYNLCLPGAVDVRELLVAPNNVLHAATWGRGAWKVVTGPIIE